METLTVEHERECRRHLFGPWSQDKAHRYWHSHCTRKQKDGNGGTWSCAATCVPNQNQICKQCKHPLKQLVSSLGEAVELACMNNSCPRQGEPVGRVGFRSEHDTPEKFGRAPTNRGVFGNNLGSYGARKNRQMILKYIRKQPPFPYNTVPNEGSRPVNLGRATERKKLTADFRKLEKYVSESEEPNPNLKRMKQILSEHLQQFKFEDHKDELLDRIAAHVGKYLRPVEERLPRREIVDYLDTAFFKLGIPLINQDQEEEVEK